MYVNFFWYNVFSSYKNELVKYDVNSERCMLSHVSS